MPRLLPYPEAQGLMRDKGEVHPPPPMGLSGAFGLDMRDFSLL